MITRIALSLATIGLTVAPFAMAEETVAPTDWVNVEVPTDIPCRDVTAEERGRCITDAEKTWKYVEHTFEEALEAVRIQWNNEQALKDLTVEEHTKLRRQFQNELHAERKAFKDGMKQLRHTFFAEQEAARKAGVSSSSSSSSRRRAPGLTLREAIALCRKVEPRNRRACIRLAQKTTFKSSASSSSASSH